MILKKKITLFCMDINMKALNKKSGVKSGFSNFKRFLGLSVLT